MENYHKTTHTVNDMKYYLVRIKKYRKPILLGEVAERIWELVRKQCKSMDLGIIRGHISRDYFHLIVSVPPQHSVSKVMKKIKGKTSHKLLMEFDTLQRKIWGYHLWVKGYFAASAGNVIDEGIMKYIYI
jgi:putative transposase